MTGPKEPPTTTANTAPPAPTPKDLQSKASAYDLTINNLQNLVTFKHTPAGLCLVSQVSLPAGAHFAYLTAHEPQPHATWKTIQTSATTHTDPQSALLYMNHSCAPSLEVHTYAPDARGKYPAVPPEGGVEALNGAVAHRTERGLAGEVRVARDRDVKVGDALTFFYPSTEWRFDRAFECLCGAGEACLGTVQGAAVIETKKLDRWFVNEHIWQMARERDGKEE